MHEVLKRLGPISRSKLLLLTSLVVLALVGVMTVVQPRSKSAGIKIGVNVADCSKDRTFECYQKRYRELTLKQAPKAAFADLKQAYDQNSMIVSNCHQLTHVIGRAAGERYRDVPEAYNQGDSFCWSGYYHGVMEAVATKIGLSNIRSQANQICASVSGRQEYSFFHYNCVHGLGHGFMFLTDDELFESLRMCDLITDQWERQSCFGGVFMENINGNINEQHRTKYLKVDQPLYPCDTVAEAYKEQCYLMQTSYALRALSNDFNRVFALCATVNGNYRPTCYKSLGRDASGQSNSDITQTHDTCLLGQTDEAKSNCVIGAVKDFISYYHGDSQAKQLCDSFKDLLADTCHRTAKEYYQLF